MVTQACVCKKKILTSIDIESSWEFCVIRTDVPKEDTKGINVDSIVIRTGEKFRGHVDRDAYNGQPDDKDYFMAMACLASRRSKDPSRQVMIV